MTWGEKIYILCMLPMAFTLYACTLVFQFVFTRSFTWWNVTDSPKLWQLKIVWKGEKRLYGNPCCLPCCEIIHSVRAQWQVCIDQVRISGRVRDDVGFSLFALGSVGKIAYFHMLCCLWEGFTWKDIPTQSSHTLGPRKHIWSITSTPPLDVYLHH